MKTLVHGLISILVFAITGLAWADPPATQALVKEAVQQPNYTSYYTGQIKAIGKGTMDLHVLRGHSGIIHPVNVDEKTVVVLLDGKTGKLSDLKVGQWVKVYWNTFGGTAVVCRPVLRSSPTGAVPQLPLASPAAALPVYDRP